MIIMVNYIEGIPVMVQAYLHALPKERVRLGLTVQELAKRAGVRKEIIEAYEAGTGTPTKSKYDKLASVFGWETWQEIEERQAPNG